MGSLNLSALRKVPKNISTGEITLDGTDRLNFNNHVYATKFFGNGSGLTDLDTYTKTEITNMLQGLRPKALVKAATTTNINLESSQTIDDIVVNDGDRVLVKNQTNTAENGIYVVGAGSWVRASDMDVWDEVPSAYVFVEQGTKNKHTGWVCTSAASGTIESSDITFTQFTGPGLLSGTNGIKIINNQVQLDLQDTDTLAPAYLGTGTPDNTNFLRGDGVWEVVNKAWEYKNSNCIVNNKDRILADTSASAFTITLPLTPSQGDEVHIVDAGCSFSINNLTINPNGKSIIGESQNLILDISNQGVVLIYSGDAKGWIVL